MGLATVLLVVPAAIIIILLLWIRYKHNYWHRRHIATESMSTAYRIKQRIHPAFILQDIYKKLRTSGKPYAALYYVISPGLLLADLDILKNVFVSEFQSFPDRGFYTNYENDPLSKNLLRLHGDLWKKVRSKLTPTFTSGKMKMMFTNVATIGQRFVEATRENVNLHNGEVEIKDICSRFTTDVIGRVAFGLECNSLFDPLAEFRVKGEEAFYTIHPLCEMLFSNHPKFFNRLGFKVFSNDIIQFYTGIIKENVEYRKRNKLEYNDFLDILIELMNSNESGGDFLLDMEDVIAQAFVFFVAGFETSSSTMVYAIYELVHNPVIQQKARKNIEETLEKHNGQFTYDSLQEMSYVKQIVQETLRKHPVVPIVRRLCRQSVTLPTSDNLTIRPGEYVLAPVYAIHHDPAYYPEPEIFRPERFSNEEKEGRHPMAYIPFGAGPRICIAKRFGMMLSMFGVALLIKNFRFSVCSKTAKNLNFDPNNIRVFSVKEGLYFKLEKV